MSSAALAPGLRPALSHEEVLAKCAYFTRAQLWPTTAVLDPRRWLENFRSPEMQHATHLLNAFTYFSTAMVRQMFAASFQSLSRDLAAGSPPFITLSARWRRFVDSAIVTYVTGEIESPTDSGFIFARMCRDTLGISEGQIVSPERALEMCLSGPPRPVIFVDDFVGTGNQFIETWHRIYPVLSGHPISFAAISAIRSVPFYYVSVLATAGGIQRITTACPAVRLAVANEIAERHSMTHPDCPFWPAHLKSSAVEFLKTVSLRAGIPDTDGVDVDDWQGFHKLALAIGFEHGTPDATLPLFRWNSENWISLRRTS